MYRKQDLTETYYNDVKSDKSYEIYNNIQEIDINYIEKFCSDKKCRCYIMFLDKMVFKVLFKMKLSLGNFKSFLDTEFYETSGLHLIDIDNLDQNMINSTKDWLLNKGILERDILVIPSKSGYSIIFKSKSEIVKLYEDTFNDEDNKAHLAASMNLFIPDFYDR